MITIRHTHLDGTTVEGTRRGDGTQAALKASGFRWSRHLDTWYLPQSRDRLARRDIITALADQLRDEGHPVDVEVDDTPRAAAEVEANRAARAAARAERLTARAKRARAESGTHDQAARAISNAIPLGQPILVDHYSATRMIRDRDRMARHHQASLDADRKAKRAEHRAELAGNEHASRHEPLTVARRIDRLETELRKLERADLAPQIDQVREQLAYWRRVRADQIASGQVADYGPHTIRAGDRIKYRSTWYRVERANQKTVSIRSRVGGNWTDRIAYHQISGHEPAP